MPILRMPDGTQVSFPDDMPQEQIRGMIQKKFPNTDLTGKDPGFWAGAGRAARGLATGAETTIDELATHVPFVGAHDPKLTEKTLQERRPPKDDIEGFSNAIGEILPSFMIPHLGLDAAAVRALRFARGLRGRQLTQFARQKGAAAALERIGGSAVEGAGRGALGGAMMPGDDTTENAQIGGAVGAVTPGAGALAQSAIMNVSPKLKNTLSAIAAVVAANKMGMPLWFAFMHPGNWAEGSVFQRLYRSNLADIAAKHARGVTKAVNPATLGAGAVELKDYSEGQ